MRAWGKRTARPGQCAAFSAACLIVSLTLACAGGGSGTITTPTPVEPGEAGGSNGSSEPQRVPSPTPSDPTASPRSPAVSLTLQPAFPGLIFQRLLGLHQLPNGNWLALEQRGVVFLIDAAASQTSVFLDIEDRVQSDAVENGLVGLALAPDFSQSGIFYVYYTAPEPFRSVLSRFHADGAAALPGSESVLMEIGQPHVIHNGGQMVFGPDGYLYLAVGDGGGFSDPFGNAQNRNTLLGSLLRIDVSGEAGYRIPPDNPFAGATDARGEIWAYGFRNPWRFSFDRPTGRLWLADTGEKMREEINLIEKGKNYGWSILEGSVCFRDEACSAIGLEPPLFEYSHSERNCAITGGFVYRGDAMPDLHGAYLYADFCSGRIWALTLAGDAVAGTFQIADADFRISSFAESNAGEIYVLEYDSEGGEVYKLIADGS